VAEAIYGALFDSAPSLQALFVSPRAVQAMRFFAGINTMITSLHNPPELKSHVETLGFGHLDKDVTVPRAVLFRDAIVDLFVVELGSKFTSASASGTVALLNYIAGSLIYIRATYADRLAVLKESWAIANDSGGNNDKFATLGSQEGPGQDAAAKHKEEGGKVQAGEEGAGAAAAAANAKQDSMMQNVPTTFREMFMFNAAVMGFGQASWMNEVLAQFDNIVTNVANSGRLQEECCVLVLRIAKVTSANVKLAEFKSCMLASLRSLLPKDWTTNHEVSWSWLWENVEKLLMTTMGKTQGWGKSVADLIESIDDATGYSMREEIYAKFFAACPAGESFFKQSNTYLHIVATKIIQMSVEMYQDPIRMVDDISGLGLRHVGYAIPTELFGPFVSVCVEVVKGLGATESAVDGFRWSLALVAKMQTRTILEGSTIVMKAINVNSEASLNKAVGCAPRGERANWMLIIVVGTQDISPFLWSIQSGALNAASAMLKDLLTIRADRDKYYYGAEDLFKRHNDVVKVILDDAPVMLPHLLDGLVWRSRVTVNGHRRVNYFLKDLLCGPDGSFQKTLEWSRMQGMQRLCAIPF
jgi:hemoglobin-like flavoprotein